MEGLQVHRPVQSFVFKVFRVVLLVFGALFPFFGGLREGSVVVLWFFGAGAVFTATRLRGPDGKNLIDTTPEQNRYLPTLVLPVFMPAFSCAVGYLFT